MFGFKYLKTDPTSYIFEYKNGKPVREGTGLSFFYFAPASSLVLVPMQSTDVPFMFQDVSSDFQEVNIQGQVTYRVVDAKKVSTMLNFTLKPNGSDYVAEDPQKLQSRALNAVQVQISAVLRTLPLQQILSAGDSLLRDVKNGLQATQALADLGVEISDLLIFAVRPTPDTARALEAKVREALLKESDDATYARRNAAIEQERCVKENELRTEIAVQMKKRDIQETQLESERIALEKRLQIQNQELEGKIQLEEKNKALVALVSDNSRVDADSRAYALNQTMDAISKVDPKILQALALSGGANDPSTLIALAFQGLAENASKIGELNISSELLQQLITKKK